MSLTNLSLVGNNLIIPDQGEFGKGTGKSLTFFYSVAKSIPKVHLRNLAKLSYIL